MQWYGVEYPKGKAFIDGGKRKGTYYSFTKKYDLMAWVDKGMPFAEMEGYRERIISLDNDLRNMLKLGGIKNGDYL
jgi:hypothetical protein